MHPRHLYPPPSSHRHLHRADDLCASPFEGSVGKTSLVTRYVQNTFNERHVTTIQASFLTKRLNVDGSRVNISIWVSNLLLSPLISRKLLTFIDNLLDYSYNGRTQRDRNASMPLAPSIIENRTVPSLSSHYASFCK